MARIKTRPLLRSLIAKAVHTSVNNETIMPVPANTAKKAKNTSTYSKVVMYSDYKSDRNRSSSVSWPNYKNKFMLYWFLDDIY